MSALRSTLQYLPKRLAKKLYFYVRGDSLRRRFASPSALILMYHGVSASPENRENGAFKHVFIGDFEEQVRFFCRHYTPVSLGELVSRLQTETLRGDEVVLTFDDGYRNNFLQAFPVLRKYEVPATVFLATDYIGTDRWLWLDEIEWMLRQSPRPELRLDAIGHTYDLGTPAHRTAAIGALKEALKLDTPGAAEEVLGELRAKAAVPPTPPFGDFAFLSWTEVREMSRQGVEFGAHGRSHRILTQIPTEEARREILQSKSIIEQQIEQPVRYFGYPNGKAGDFSETIQSICRPTFMCAVSAVCGRVGTAHPDLFALPRISVSADLTLDALYCQASAQ